MGSIHSHWPGGCSRFDRLHTFLHLDTDLPQPGPGEPNRSQPTSASVHGGESSWDGKWKVCMRNPPLLSTEDIFRKSLKSNTNHLKLSETRLLHQFQHHVRFTVFLLFIHFAMDKQIQHNSSPSQINQVTFSFVPACTWTRGNCLKRISICPSKVCQLNTGGLYLQHVAPQHKWS